MRNYILCVFMMLKFVIVQIYAYIYYIYYIFNILYLLYYILNINIFIYIILYYCAEFVRTITNNICVETLALPLNSTCLFNMAVISNWAMGIFRANKSNDRGYIRYRVFRKNCVFSLFTATPPSPTSL